MTNAEFLQHITDGIEQIAIDLAKPRGTGRGALLDKQQNTLDAARSLQAYIRSLRTFISTMPNREIHST